jgi:hypothetical protein
MPWVAAGASLIGGWYANKQAKKAQGAANEQADWAYQQSQPQNYQGMFGGYNTGTGEYLNEDMQAMMQQYMDRQQATGAQIGDYSPEEYAQNMYDTDLAMLNPELQQQSQAMESRLLSQGRLGSTGGAGQFGGLMQAQNMTRLGLRRDSYNKSQQQLDAMRRRQGEDMMSAIGIGQLASGYGTQSLNFANQRGQNAWNAANMKSGAALGKAGATAGMINSGLQGFNSQRYGQDGKQNQPSLFNNIGQYFSGMWGNQGKTFNPTNAQRQYYGAGSPVNF